MKFYKKIEIVKKKQRETHLVFKLNDGSEYYCSNFFENDYSLEDCRVVKSLIPDFLKDKVVGYYIYQPLTFSFKMDGAYYEAESLPEPKYYAIEKGILWRRQLLPYL